SGAVRGWRLTEEPLRIGGRGDVDVAAFGIGDHEQAVLLRARDRPGESSPAGRPEPLEARDLELYGDALLARGLDRERAVRLDRARCALLRRSGRSGGRLGQLGCPRPQPHGVRVEAE